MIEEDQKIKPSVVKERIKARYDVDVQSTLLVNALIDVKKSLSFDNQAFGLVSSFLKVLERDNEGTTTSVQ